MRGPHRKTDYERGYDAGVKAERKRCATSHSAEYWKSRYLLLEKTYEEDIKRLKEK